MSFDVLGIIAPHPPIMVEAVGGPDSAVTESSARALRAAGALLTRFRPDAVVLISPHTEGFTDAFTVSAARTVSGTLARFGAAGTGLQAKGHPDLADAIIREAETAGLATVARERYAHLDRELDHGVVVPMHFIDPEGAYPLVVVSFTYRTAVDHLSFGRCIKRAAQHLGLRVALVASGDCSHRLTSDAPAGYAPAGRVFDEQLVRLLDQSDWEGIAAIDEDLREQAGECGWRSFLILGGFMEGSDSIARVLSYEGPWGVGYLTAVVAPKEELDGLPAFTPSTGTKGGSKGCDTSQLVRLARATIEARVREEEPPHSVLDADPLLPARAGVFVSLHARGDLRGCIGTITATCATLAEEIAHSAIEAATEDPRFSPVRTSELDGLEISVDVLYEPEAITSLDDLDPSRYGVIVTAGWRRGLLLPDLEGVDTAAMQVDIARRKAGIEAGEPIRLERFKVDRYE